MKSVKTIDYCWKKTLFFGGHRYLSEAMLVLKKLDMEVTFVYDKETELFCIYYNHSAHRNMMPMEYGLMKRYLTYLNFAITKVKCGISANNMDCIWDTWKYNTGDKTYILFH